MDLKPCFLTGHIGKLIKVAGGIMNTHSQEGDCRMELITSSALSAGADADTARQILSCVTTEEAVNVLKKAGLCEKTMELIMQKIMFYLNKRAAGENCGRVYFVFQRARRTWRVQGRQSCLRD